MVGPVNGAYAQQVAISNPFQAENNKQTQETDAREQKARETQSTNETSESSGDNNRLPVQTAASSSEQSQSSSGSERERGSLLDITV